MQKNVDATGKNDREECCKADALRKKHNIVLMKVKAPKANELSGKGQIENV